MGATMSLIGLYLYNEQLFDGLKLPAGVDKDNLVSNLLAECAEFEILYSDPEFLANMISVWSSKELPNWEKLYNTTVFEYDPISNYDRHEEWSNSGNSKGSVAGFNSETLVTTNGAESATSHKGRVHGNIGITTTQQMIEEERRVVAFNIVDHIIVRFKQRFCLLIY